MLFINYHRSFFLTLMLTAFLFGCVTQTESVAQKEVTKLKQKAKTKADYTQYKTLALQYRGYGYENPSRLTPDMVEYEKKLKNRLLKYGVIIYRKDAQIYLEFPTQLIFEKLTYPAITPDAYLGVLSSFVYVLLTNKGTSIEIKGFSDSWLLAQQKANSLAGYLHLRGIATERLTATAYQEIEKENILEVILTPL